MSNKCNCQIPNTDLTGRCFKCGGTIEIPADVQERIKADAAKAYPLTNGNDLETGKRIGYIAGATAENSRAQVLVDALEEFISYHETGLLPARHVYEKAVAKLEQWKGKEVEG